MSPRNPNPRAVLLLCGLLAAGGAYALKSDRNKPINIQADHADFRADPKNDSNGTGIYTGHVVITQGSIVLTADKATLHVVNNELDTADITGNPATFQQQPDTGAVIHGYALEITYVASKNQIDLVTNARLIQPVNQTNGVTLAASTNVSPSTVTAGAPSGTSDEPPPYISQGERLMTADHIRYNTETQRMVATGGKDEGRVRITFPPKLLPTERPQAERERKREFRAEKAAAEASRAAAAKMSTLSAATRAAPPAASHSGAPP